jgi:hypothetical protein
LSLEFYQNPIRFGYVSNGKIFANITIAIAYPTAATAAKIGAKNKKFRVSQRWKNRWIGRQL